MIRKKGVTSDVMQANFFLVYFSKITQIYLFYSFLSYFFVKKIPLSRRVEYVIDGSMDESVSQ